MAEVTAAYNFVKLNKNVLPAPVEQYVVSFKDADEQKKGFKSFLSDAECKYSGYFDVTIKNITPLFIGGSEKMFSDGKNFCILGSSVRGCIKNIMKIVTNGSMQAGDNGDIEDRIIYFRDVASDYKKSRNYYLQELQTSGSKKRGDLPTKGGFLVRKPTGQFYICPAGLEPQKLEGTDMDDTSEACVKWNGATANVFTGPMNGKAHYYRISAARWNAPISIGEEVIKVYRNDKERTSRMIIPSGKRDENDIDSLIAEGFAKCGQDVCDAAKIYDFVTPCFYALDDNGSVKYFGANPFYRLIYKKNLAHKDHLPKELSESHIDFATAIFGNKEVWGSRVFFENAYIEQNEGALMDADVCRPLASPKTTSFQNYLETDDYGKSEHWDGNTKLRGYKMYWHRKPDWHAGVDDNENMVQTIAPVKVGNKFRCKLRFERLTVEELGALAKVLSLCEKNNGYMKLGMGRALGLGSVDIKATLHLKNEDYYTKLFNGSGFAESLKKAEKSQYIDEFDRYRKDNLSEQENKLYDERMKELAIIMQLHDDIKGWQKKTSPLSVDDEEGKLITGRIPLPTITEVVRGGK